MTPLDPDSIAAVLSSLRAGVVLDRALRAMRVSAARWQDARALDVTFMEQEREAAEEGTRARAAVTPSHLAATKDSDPGVTRGGSGGPGSAAPSRSGAGSDGHPRGSDSTEAGAAPALADVARASAALPPVWTEAREARRPASDAASSRPRIELGPPAMTDDFARVRVEAEAAYGSGRLATLLWIDARCQMMRPALHPIDPLWIEKLSAFYDTGKMIMVARKGLRAGGSSTACPALVRCAEFADRHLDAGTIGVIPIMSASRDEADGRFVTIRATLRAMGLTPEKDDEDRDMPYLVPPGGLTGTYRSKKSQSGGGIIAILDARGHRMEFKILPALVRHGIGWTGGGGFADESDQWPNDPDQHVNPADVILDRVSERFTTQPSAEFFIFSASYHAKSAHQKLIDEGDTPLQHVARNGERAAVIDTEERGRLAALYGLTDPRLLAAGDPMSPDLPAWVFNRAIAPIERCYQISKGNVSRMLGLYGGRAAENAARGGNAADQINAIAKALGINVDKPHREREPSGGGWPSGML